MKKKSVLIVVRDFPPYYRTLGGVLRAVKLAEFLDDRGLEVHVVAASGEAISYFGYEELIRRLRVHYVDDPIRRLSNRRTVKATSNKAKRSAWRAGLVRFAQLLADDILVPDLGVLFVGRLYKAAREVIKQHAIKNVFVSSPPHSTQLVGLRLKRELGDGINLFVDYRDSWNCRQICSKHNPLSRTLSTRLEKRVLNATDHFTYVSEPILAKINRRYFDMSQKSLLVMNGFDPGLRLTQQTGSLPTNQRLTIGCFGRISEIAQEGRDPTRFLEVVAELRLPVTIVFYGDIDHPQAWTGRFSKNVDIRGNLPHREAIGRMQCMDLLLLPDSQTQGADEVISGRLFDYMLAGRPILVVGPKDIEAGKIVTRYQLGYHFDINDGQAMADGVMRIYEAWKDCGLPKYDWKDLQQFTRQNQFAKLLPIFV